jgi:hypothetical protein
MHKTAPTFFYGNSSLDDHSIENADHHWTDYELMNKLPDLELGCNRNCIKVHQCCVCMCSADAIMHKKLGKKERRT